MSKADDHAEGGSVLTDERASEQAAPQFLSNLKPIIVKIMHKIMYFRWLSQ